MTKRRGPYSDPRQGSVLQRIDNAFTSYGADTLDASIPMEWGSSCDRAPASGRVAVSEP
jgi:hypothetical protein